MYGPPRACKRDSGTKYSLRKCIRPCWRIPLQALDEFRASLSCLIGRPSRHVYHCRFSATPFDCFFVRRFSFADFVEKLFPAVLTLPLEQGDSVPRLTAPPR